MLSDDNISILLAGRTGVYRTLQNILGNEPSKEMLEQLSAKATQSVFLLFDNEEDGFKPLLETLFSAAEECLNHGSEALDRLESGFTRLFVGPGAVEAPPWESFYVRGEKAIKQRTSLEVRKAYVAQGLIPAAYPSVADDHIAIELDFLTRLAQRASDAYAINDVPATLLAVDASEMFLREHLLKWVSAFASAVANARHASFYQETAAVLEAFLPIDLEALADLQNALRE
jgi:TorA maturation chaperone TorD